MFCRNCGKDVHPQAIVCPACGVPPHLEKKFCPSCGTATEANQILCVKCGSTLNLTAANGGRNKVAAGLLALFLGWLGIHKFYLGYNKEGLILLLASTVGGVVTCGLSTWVVSLLAVVEGIIYLTRSDEEFARLYVLGRQTWF